METITQAGARSQWRGRPAETLLARLEGVRRTGDGRWLARCPAHADKSPSLSIRELDDGRVLVHCFAGCAAADVLAAVGLQFSDLFPERLGDRLPREWRPFDPADALRVLAREAEVVRAAAILLAVGGALTEEDRARLGTAANRIERAAAVCGEEVRP